MSDTYATIAFAIAVFLMISLMMAGYQLTHGRTRTAGSILILNSSMALAAVVSLGWTILV